jgi:hypothetical protein
MEAIVRKSILSGEQRGWNSMKLKLSLVGLYESDLADREESHKQGIPMMVEKAVLR